MIEVNIFHMLKGRDHRVLNVLVVYWNWDICFSKKNCLT